MTFERLIDHQRLDASLRVPHAEAEVSDPAQEVTSLASRLEVANAADGPRLSWLFGKRLLDLGLGIALAVVALPVIAVLAACVAVSFRTWPLFMQRRVGRNGRLFPFPKLRTLPRSTPRYASKYDLPSDLGRLASFLRRTHLDELPQLLVVPLGWMSLVGPRPEMPQGIIATPRWYDEARTRVPQGCTGLWQISPHTHLLLHEAPEYDLFYARHASLRLDVWILWRTALQFIGRADPVRIEDVPEWAKSKSMRLLEANATP